MILELDRAFVEKIASSRGFPSWVPKQTKFLGLADELIFPDIEQAEARPREKPGNWWRFT